jgi:hypothetical protein
VSKETGLPSVSFDCGVPLPVFLFSATQSRIQWAPSELSPSSAPRPLCSGDKQRYSDKEFSTFRWLVLAYLTTLIQLHIFCLKLLNRPIVDGDLEKIRKEAIVVCFNALTRYLTVEIKENTRILSGWTISGPRFESSTSRIRRMLFRRIWYRLLHNMKVFFTLDRKQSTPYGHVLSVCLSRLSVEIVLPSVRGHTNYSFWYVYNK